MKAKRIITISVLSIAVAIAATFGIIKQTQSVKAQDQATPPEPERISFGMVGITSGQTIRVSVANTLMPNDASLPPGPVRVVMTFRGMNGQLIRNRNGDVIRRAVELERGEAALLDVDYDQLPPSPIRVQVRPVVTLQYPSEDIAEHKPFVVSTEVINNANGRTQFGAFPDPAVIRGFNPQPDPPIGD